MANHTFTRQGLYELVWSESMIKVAARYAITGRGLAKACERARIPVPDRGYWAKVAAGQKVAKPSLPEAKAGIADRVSISPSGPRIERTAPASCADRSSQNRRIATPRRSHFSSRDPLRPAPDRRPWLQRDREEREKSRRDGWLARIYEPIDKSDLDKRRLRILSTLFQALEARSYKLIVEGSS